MIALESLSIGRFVRRTPNAIGRRRSGSYFFTIARYKSTQATTSIMIVFTASAGPLAIRAAIPVLPKKLPKLSNTFVTTFHIVSLSV